MNIGEMIKFYRLKKGLTQAQLSQLTDISLSSIKQYEIGKIKPKHEQLSKIAKALSISEVVFYEFNLDTVGDVVSLLFLMDDAVDIEIIGEKDKLEEKYLPDTVSLKFKNPYLRKFMADWALMKEYLNNVDDDIKKIKNPDVQESVRNDFNNKYQEFKTLYTTNIHHNVVVKKGTDGIKIRISNNDKDNKYIFIIKILSFYCHCIKRSPETLINSMFRGFYRLFPLDSAWWLSSNIIHYSIDRCHFVYDSATNLFKNFIRNSCKVCCHKVSSCYTS